MPGRWKLTWRSRLILLFLLGVLHAAAYAWLVPPWQAPDEPGHFEYACLLGELAQPLKAANESPNLELEIIGSLARNDFWPRVREPWPDPLPTRFAQDPFLVRGGRQVGDEPPLHYLVPALICRQPWTVEARLVGMRLYGALLLGLTGVVAAWGLDGGTTNSTPQTKEARTRGLLQAAGQLPTAIRVLTPLALVLLPMPAFIAGSSNNDALAMLTATAVFAALARIQRLGLRRQGETGSWRSWLRLLGLLILLAMALASKKTNAFLLPWVCLLAVGGAWRLLWPARKTSQHRRWLAPVLVALLLGLVLSMWLPSAAPTAWRGHRQPLGQGQVVLDPHQGHWAALAVDRTAGDYGRLMQSVVGPLMHELRGQEVQASIWVRSVDGAPQPGRLTVRDARRYTQQAFVADGQWRRISLVHTVDPATSHVKITVAPGIGSSEAETGSLLVDDVALHLAGGANLLRNPGFEQPARWGELLILAPLELRWQQFAPRFQDSDAFTWRAWQRYGLYTALLFPGFWGNFGWLQLPLPVAIYGLLALVCLLAGLGLIRQLLAWRASVRAVPLSWTSWAQAGARPWTRVEAFACSLQLASTWLLAVALLLVQTLLPMLGRSWQPQGRYLFPGLLPIVGLLLIGLDHWLAFDSRWQRAAALLVSLVAFALYCLLAIILPSYSSTGT